MSLLSSIILPKLEKEILALEPYVAEFILKQVKNIGAEIFAWAENKFDHVQRKESISQQDSQ